MERRPILLNSCARATSAAEARFRIGTPIAGRPGARVVALDDAAGAVVRWAARQRWNGARFYALADRAPTGGAGSGNGRAPDDLALRTADGDRAHLHAELVGADVVVLVATADADGTAAAAVGRACARRGIMTAGLVLGERDRVGAALAALRPHTQVLMVSADDQDVLETLTALRA